MVSKLVSNLNLLGSKQLSIYDNEHGDNNKWDWCEHLADIRAELDPTE